jgi:hypothetical protein
MPRWGKWTIGIVGLLIVIGALAGDPEKQGNQAAETTATDQDNKKTPSEDEEGDEKTVGKGQPLLLEGTQYRVLSAETARSVGGELTRETAPAGTTYVIVRLELTNKKDETHRVVTEAIKLISANGKEYSPDTDASVAALSEGDRATLLLEEIQPDVPKTGNVIFAVPRNQVSGSKLRVEDLFSDSHGFIRLGL